MNPSDIYIYIHMWVISINIWGHTSIHSITANNSRSKRDQLRCVSLTNICIYIYICWSSLSVSKDTPSSTVLLPPWKRPKEITRAVHCWSFAYIYTLFVPNDTKSGIIGKHANIVRTGTNTCSIAIASGQLRSERFNSEYIEYIYILFVSKCYQIRNHRQPVQQLQKGYEYLFHCYCQWTAQMWAIQFGIFNFICSVLRLGSLTTIHAWRCLTDIYIYLYM